MNERAPNTLYTKTRPRGRGFGAPAKPPKREWDTPKKSPVSKKNTPYTTWFLIGSIGFFGLALLVALVMFFLGGRTISPQNLGINIEAPAAIASGEPARFVIEVANTNPVHLPFAEVTLTFPQGTRDAEDVTKELTYVVHSLDGLRAGQKKEFSQEAVLFGTEGEEKEVKVRVEFRPENSNAIVVKEETYKILISSAPLTVTLTAPENVSVGESFSTIVSVQTNTKESVPNAVLLLEYPFGYSVRDVSPQASFGDFVWELGTLRPGEKKTITITGDLTGSTGEERFIKASIGTDLSANKQTLGLVYMTQDTKVSLQESALALSVSLDGDARNQITAEAGDTLTGRLTWRNNTGSKLYDGEIRIAFSGNAFDASRIESGRGVYDQGTQTFIFTGDTNRELDTLDPDERGTITFTVPIKNTNALSGVRNPALSFTASLEGKDVGSGSPAPLSVSVEKQVQISSGLSLASTLTRTIGTFQNVGPWPPAVGEETTYTLTLTAANTVNTVANTVVKTTLPSYVRFTGAANPSNASVSYTEQTGELVWNVGELASYSSRSVAIQVGLTPTGTQVGQSPIVVESQILQGFDRYVQETIQVSAGAHTTVIETDPAYTGSQGTVVNQ